ncbi:hypothetical protein BT63DRAFT_275165 [Microthyrium microscopicum]|uniref:HTH CENPB-type domain-containing protein n=1 Tax=Microthyrium microscopicum TaxID=703497 RepID=A0A6A6U8A6_9PEZI|nr:hypothetical protein BT63DRAFT_275165 [Microthyrium microscopicum]
MDPDQHPHDQNNGMHDVHGMWVEGGTPYQSHHQSPVHEYPGFAFNGMSMDSVYAPNSMPPPTRNTQPQLYPLITTPWPSMLTSSQSNHGTPVYNSPPASGTSVSTPMSAPPTSGRTYDRPRRTLTDVERRKMCEYSETHPGVKQTEIGAMFGVERSTVSKVLRNKEKYLSQDESAKTQLKAKGKFPDIERALSNWAKNEKKHNRPVTDAQILEKFKHFARTVRDPDQQLKSVNTSWLAGFKQKNGINTSKSRKNSAAEVADTRESVESSVPTPNISPTSPQIKRDASPSGIDILKEEKLPKKIKSESPPAHFSDAGHGHRPYASIGSAFTDVGSISFSTDTLSPTPSFFSNTNPFNNQQPVQPVHAGMNTGYQNTRPRSQTFPIGTSADNGSYASTPTSDAQMSHFLMASGPLESTPELLPTAHTQESFLPTTSMSKEGTSSPGLGLIASSPLTPAASVASVSTPSIDETRRALEVVLTFMNQQHAMNEQEFQVMAKLMEKLRLQSGHAGEIPGSRLHSISEAVFPLGRSIAE